MSSPDNFRLNEGFFEGKITKFIDRQLTKTGDRHVVLMVARRFSDDKAGVTTLPCNVYGAPLVEFVLEHFKVGDSVSIVYFLRTSGSKAGGLAVIVNVTAIRHLGAGASVFLMYGSPSNEGYRQRHIGYDDP